jgi:exosortase C (VPDSG-CTERM-specific)
MQFTADQGMTAASVDQRTVVPTTWRDRPRPQRLTLAALGGYLVALTLLFIQPLGRLAIHAAHSNLHSYVILVPFISAYLLYTDRRSFPASYRTSIPGAVVASAIGIAALVGRTLWAGSLTTNDALGLTALAFVSLLTAGGFAFLGSRWMASAAFPVAFLLFMVPLPDAAVNWLESVSVLGTADATALFFGVAGTSFVRNGTVFELPGIAIRVAQECSGIRSSWVLFITSLLASHLFLRTRWRKTLLVAFVIPLGILRNGFRVFVIGLLCVHVGPHMIYSTIHRRGGPLFFVLSLIPLLLLLWWLKHQEQPRGVPG